MNKTIIAVVFALFVLGMTVSVSMPAMAQSQSTAPSMAEAGGDATMRPAYIKTVAACTQLLIINQACKAISSAWIAC